MLDSNSINLEVAMASEPPKPPCSTVDELLRKGKDKKG